MCNHCLTVYLPTCLPACVPAYLPDHPHFPQFTTCVSVIEHSNRAQLSILYCVQAMQGAIRVVLSPVPMSIHKIFVFFWNVAMHRECNDVKCLLRLACTEDGPSFVFLRFSRFKLSLLSNRKCIKLDDNRPQFTYPKRFLVQWLLSSKQQRFLSHLSLCSPQLHHRMSELLSLSMPRVLCWGVRETSNRAHFHMNYHANTHALNNILNAILTLHLNEY